MNRPTRIAEEITREDQTRVTEQESDDANRKDVWYNDEWIGYLIQRIKPDPVGPDVDWEVRNEHKKRIRTVEDPEDGIELLKNKHLNTWNLTADRREWRGEPGEYHRWFYYNYNTDTWHDQDELTVGPETLKLLNWYLDQQTIEDQYDIHTDDGIGVVFFFRSTGYYDPGSTHGGSQGVGWAPEGDEERTFDFVEVDGNAVPEAIAHPAFDEYQQEIDELEMDFR